MPVSISALGTSAFPRCSESGASFEATEEKYRAEGYLGCLLGGLGQELSGVSEASRRKVEQCFSEIARRIAGCLQLAVESGELPGDANPARLAELLVNCWEGGALRTRLRRDPAQLREMLDSYFSTAANGVAQDKGTTKRTPR